MDNNLPECSSVSDRETGPASVPWEWMRDLLKLEIRVRIMTEQPGPILRSGKLLEFSTYDIRSWQSNRV